MTQEVKFPKQLFRLSQKALFFDAEHRTYLVLRVSKPKKNKPHHVVWTKKYGPWDLPGGHVDADEKNLFRSFEREVKEESGISIGEPCVLCHTEVMENEKAEYLGLNHVYLISYSGEKIALSDEHVEFKWMSADDIKNDKNIKKWIKDSVEKAENLVNLTESLNSWKRCLADFDNYKKRQTENQKEFTQYAAEGVIVDMLPILDNFHAATDHIPESDAESPWVTGIMFIQQQMEKVFEENNVTKIEVNIGDEFDPSIMEAIKNDEGGELDENVTVLKIAQHGYRIGEKVLRPARVVLK